MLSQKYEIVIKDNNFAMVSKIEHDTYKILEKKFEGFYHTKNGDTYQLHKNFDAGVDIVIVDDNHLNELLDDMHEQGFLDTVGYNILDEYDYDACVAF